MTYTKLNNLVGWAVFAVATLTYGLTVEPTASFWDCGEFIATANELEVPHPPGAPLHLLTGRLFALAGHLLGGPEQVALAVNWVSVLASAALALFICWTTTLLAKRVLAPAAAEPDRGTQAVILFSGAVAGLTCTFLDTVWFNAVEAEVYAYSSAFTAAVFWLMLKWEARADQPGSNRWLILLAYLIGLAVGVHLLPLLTIPALALIYYFKKYNYSRTGVAVAFGAGVLILGLVQFGVVQKTWDIAWAFERTLVGTENWDGNAKSGLGLPMGSGVLLFTLVLLGALGYGIYYTYRRQRVNAHLGLLALLMVYLGFSSYAIIAIRSNTNPAINQNGPGNVLNFLSYVKREQYGSAPLLFGQMYNSQVIDYQKKGKNYLYLDSHDRYIVDGDKLGYKYDRASQRFFPRMHNPDHYESGPFGYKRYVSNLGADPKSPYDDKPTGLDNLTFFLDYQVGHMYLRYLGWNFIGREGETQHSGVESGLEFKRISQMPEELRRTPPKNHYYFLPLLLGLFGLVWHFFYDPRRAGVVGVLFLFTGMAIVLYLNQVAQEPRERDYAFVGSYHTFAIWVGLGVVGLAQSLQRYTRRASPYIAGGLCLVLVPGQLAAKNWDDHTRARRYLAPDSAYNILQSCDPNAIIFTNGDNDTFPLWYLQEVEGIRTDVRVVNLSLLNTDWYIYQLKHYTWNGAPPVPITRPEATYMGERGSLTSFRERTLSFPVDKAALVANGVVKAADTARVESPMKVTVKPRGSAQNGYLQKQDIMVLNILEGVAKDGWRRPVYFANTVGPSNFVSLDPFFEMHGLASRIIPLRDPKNTQRGESRMDLEKMYANLVGKFRYRGLNTPGLWVDENADRMVTNFRNTLYGLASGYLDAALEIEAQQPELRKANPESPALAENDKLAQQYRAKAKESLDFSLQAMAPGTTPLPLVTQLLYATLYADLGQTEKSAELLQSLRERALGYATYYKSIGRLATDGQEYLLALQRLLYHYLQTKANDQVRLLADDLYKLTGDKQYQELVGGLDVPTGPNPTDSAPQ